MELQKQKMSLFNTIPGLWSSKFFYKMFLIFNEKFKIDFQMKLSKQKMVLFLPLPDLWSKNFFYNIFSILPKKLEIGFQNR